MRAKQKKIFGYKKRLATKEEIKELLTYIIKKMWEDNVNYASSIGSESIAKGYELYYKEEMKLLKESVGEFIVIEEFKKFGLAIYTFSIIYDGPGLTVHVIPNRYLKNGSEFESLKEDQVLFNMDDEVKMRNNFNTKKVGRPNRPKEESILNTHEVRALLDFENMNIDDACKKIGISKSTYYRVSKWLINNTAHKSFPLN